jgi:hypothetical protein
MLNAFETNGSSPPLHPDLLVSGGGTVYLLHPTSRRGRRWIADHIRDDAQCLGSAVAVEHRYIADIVTGAIADGLRVH